MDRVMLVFVETNVERRGIGNPRRLLMSDISLKTAKKDYVRERPLYETRKTPLES